MALKMPKRLTKAPPKRRPMKEAKLKIESYIEFMNSSESESECRGRGARYATYGVKDEGCV